MKQAKEVVEVEGLNQVINGNMTSIMPMRTMIGPNLENIGVEYGERRARIGAGTDRDRGRARGHDLEGAGEGQAHEEAEIDQEMSPEASQDLDQERDERRGEDEASFPGQDQDHPQHQKALDPGPEIKRFFWKWKGLHFNLFLYSCTITNDITLSNPHNRNT